MMSAISSNRNCHSPRRSRTIGCLIGGAVGDALGAPVEFLSLPTIRERFGHDGVFRFEPAYGRCGAVTDDTQMTLFTAEGLILAKVRADYDHGGKTIPAIYHAYLRWLTTQDRRQQQRLIGRYGTCAVIDGILAGHQALFDRRAPGNTCLSALMSGRMGTVADPINGSKGCGGVMRVAPIGLAIQDTEHAFRLGAETAAITHGHPDGYLAAGAFAAMISLIAGGTGIGDAISDSCRILGQSVGHGPCRKAIDAAVDLATRDDLSPEQIESLGAGWVAEEALAIGLCCALAVRDDLRKGVLMAVNHSGDSDSTGSIAGNLLGAHLGVDGIPAAWLTDLELKAMIEEVAADLFDHYVSEGGG